MPEVKPGDWFLIGCAIGFIYGVVVHPRWCRLVDAAFERWWPCQK